MAWGGSGALAQSAELAHGTRHGARYSHACVYLRLPETCTGPRAIGTRSDGGFSSDPVCCLSFNWTWNSSICSVIGLIGPIFV